MPTRLSVIALASVLAAAAACPAPGAAAAPGRHSCKPRGSRTLASGPLGRVVQRKGQVPLSAGGAVRGSRVYGCLYATGRRRLLGFQRSVDGDEEWIEKRSVRVAGRYAGYAHGFDSGMDGGEFVEVRDLRSGRRVYRTEDNTLVNVLDLELGTTGSVAWIADEEGDAGVARGVFVWSAGTGRRRLEEGNDIAARSLSLSGSTLTWTEGGVARTAPLP